MTGPIDQNQEKQRNPRPSGPRPASPSPSLPSPEDRLEYLSTGLVRPASTPLEKHSAIHFLVHPGMQELKAYAHGRSWPEHGYTQIAVPWQELHWTTDGWKTANVLSSTDVPSPVVNGYFHLPRVPAGTEVEFAIRVGLSCHCPGDVGLAREVGELWLNNGGKNFRQVTK